MSRLTGSTASQAVADSAIEWDQWRRKAAYLRGQRASFKCEHECEAEYDDQGRMTYQGDPACWNNVHQDQHGRDCYLPADEWCQPCREREIVHKEYRMAVAKRQAYLRGLQRRCCAAVELRKMADAVPPPTPARPAPDAEPRVDLQAIARQAQADIDRIVNADPFADVGSTAVERIILRALEQSHGLPLSPPTRGGLPRGQAPDPEER